MTFLRDKFWKCIIWESNVENLIFEGAIYEKNFVEVVILKMYFWRE